MWTVHMRCLKFGECQITVEVCCDLYTTRPLKIYNLKCSQNAKGPSNFRGTVWQWIDCTESLYISKTNVLEK